jgi:hypothetical protein
MPTASHPHRRVGARDRAKLKKWSEKVTREEDARTVVAAEKGPAARRRGTLDAAKKKLRRLFR